MHPLPPIIVVACPDQGASNVGVGPLTTGRIKTEHGSAYGGSGVV